MDDTSNVDLLRPSSWRRVLPLTGDASQRRYARLWGDDDRTAVLVTYPDSVVTELRRDLEVLAWCRDQGIRVPILLAHDLAAGRALLEDLGDTDAERAIENTTPAQRRNLLDSLLRPLALLAAVDVDALPPWNPPLDGSRIRWELCGFELWYLRAFRGAAPSAVVGRWLDELAEEVAQHPRRVCHRDYHLNNLLVMEDASVGVIDIQDILIGPDTYDVVSLLFERAAQRLLTAGEQCELLEAWAAATEPPRGWRTRADVVGLQRSLKVLGTFARYTVAGRQTYQAWLEELPAHLGTWLETAGAPPEVMAILLD